MPRNEKSKAIHAILDAEWEDLVRYGVKDREGGEDDEEGEGAELNPEGWDDPDEQA